MLLPNYLDSLAPLACLLSPLDSLHPSVIPCSQMPYPNGRYMHFALFWELPYTYLLIKTDPKEYHKPI